MKMKFRNRDHTPNTSRPDKRRNGNAESKDRALKKKKLTYDPAVNRLVNAIKQEFIKLNRNGTPRVLCEMLTITNPEWANAVEGYLNTQRFYILVNPEDFDIALSIYDRLRSKKEVYGVGLVNVKPLEKYDIAPEGSLASVVTSKTAGQTLCKYDARQGSYVRALQ